jgi:hypothetical protein
MVVGQGATSRPLVVGSDVACVRPTGDDCLLPGRVSRVPRMGEHSQPSQLHRTMGGADDLDAARPPRRDPRLAASSGVPNKSSPPRGVDVAHAPSGGRLAAFLPALRHITPSVRVATPATSQESPTPAQLVATS